MSDSAMEMPKCLLKQGINISRISLKTIPMENQLSTAKNVDVKGLVAEFGGKLGHVRIHNLPTYNVIVSIGHMHIQSLNLKLQLRYQNAFLITDYFWFVNHFTK